MPPSVFKSKKGKKTADDDSEIKPEETHLDEEELRKLDALNTQKFFV